MRWLVERRGPIQPAYLIAEGFLMRFRTYCIALSLTVSLIVPISNAIAASVRLNEDFRQALSVTFRQMISSYQRGEKSPLNGDILDTANPAVADFFNFDSSIVHREKGATSQDQRDRQSKSLNSSH